MEIQELRLRISQAELNGWLQPQWGKTDKLRGFTLQVGADGLHARGEVRVGVWIAFEADAEVDADGPFVALRLTSVRPLGLIPIPGLEGMVLTMVRKYQNEWLLVKEDAVVVNIERLLADHGLALTANLSGVRCEPGALVLGRDFRGAHSAAP